MESPLIWVLGLILIASAVGILLAQKPVHSCLSFLLTLFTLALLYIQLSAQFIGVMQILVYAGAILVLFMFVIVLFQDAHQQISLTSGQSGWILLSLAAASLLLTLFYLAYTLTDLGAIHHQLPENYGTVQQLGELLYLKFFFPFEAIVVLFLAATVGTLYIAKKG